MTRPVDDRLRALPAVDQLASMVDAPARAAVSVARVVLDERRAELLAGADDSPDLAARAVERLRPRLRRVLNATGVVVHTNLGRAPLAPDARDAVARAAEGYSNARVRRPRRRARHRGTRVVEDLLREVTGAEAGLAVNNCAAAVLLAVAALGGGRRTAVSRGQLIEIGGGFRIPEVLALAGTTLVEVGTTNRTRLADYAAAEADLVLRAHPSNFRTLGFVEEVAVESLCELGVPVVDDVGSGRLADLEALADEPAVRRSVAAGAAVVCFSGDKLLGGPQAGVLVGRREAIDACRAHPLARAVRIDKLSLAALEATLALYRDPDRAQREIPVLAMLDAAPEALAARAERLAAATGGRVVEGTAKVGGGALPLLELPGPVVELPGAAALAAALRAADPPVVARVRDNALLLDPRTLTDEEADLVAAAVRAASPA